MGESPKAGGQMTMREGELIVSGEIFLCGSFEVSFFIAYFVNK